MRGGNDENLAFWVIPVPHPPPRRGGMDSSGNPERHAENGSALGRHSREGGNPENHAGPLTLEMLFSDDHLVSDPVVTLFNLIFFVNTGS